MQEEIQKNGANHKSTKIDKMKEQFLESISAFGPVLLIPSAWAVTAASHSGVIGSAPIEMMHLVMTAFLIFFAVNSRGKMEGIVLSAWQRVIIAGAVITSIVTLSLIYESSSIFSYIEIFYWMAAPAYGFYITSVETKRRFYLGAASLTFAASLIFGYSMLSGGEFTLVSIGLAAISQTAAIAEAALIENFRKND